MMAYSPFDRAELIAHQRLNAFARECDITAGQAALAWLLARDHVIPIPKASHIDRVAEDVAALEVSSSTADQAELGQIFLPPPGPQPLEIY